MITLFLQVVHTKGDFLRGLGKRVLYSYDNPILHYPKVYTNDIWSIYLDIDWTTVDSD